MYLRGLDPPLKRKPGSDNAGRPLPMMCQCSSPLGSSGDLNLTSRTPERLATERFWIVCEEIAERGQRSGQTPETENSNSKRIRQRTPQSMVGIVCRGISVITVHVATSRHA